MKKSKPITIDRLNTKLDRLIARALEGRVCPGCLAARLISLANAIIRVEEVTTPELKTHLSGIGIGNHSQLH